MIDRPQILIVDDEANVRRVLRALIEQAGYGATVAASAEEALASIREIDPQLVLTDLAMPGKDGFELLAELRLAFPEIPVVMLTAHGTIGNAVEAMRRGAFDFLVKPFEKEDVLGVIAKALGQAASLRREFQGPIDPASRCGIIGGSAPIDALIGLIERVAPSGATVLILGETGTGKELVAEALHALSPRRDRPMIRLNCGALPDQLVESELFGHERGAFTGADRARPGRIELADTGTLFLDEIGEMPGAAQVKLLRVLQDGQVDRLGSVAPRKVDVRLVAASNRDLAAEVNQGRFREDLYYRLRVIELIVPPLRDRTEDIPQLVEFFLGKHARRLGRPTPSVAPAALASLCARGWPGNVRELENAVERAVVLGTGSVLSEADFGGAGAGVGTDPARLPLTPMPDLKAASRAASEDAERTLIRAALEATGGNVTHAATRLGLSRRGLQLKMRGLL